MSNLTAHMVVKNEDQWIWYAVQSVLPYVDRLLITDTGSSDNTLKIIRSIKDKKIELNEVSISSPADLTRLRQNQLDATKTDWIWIVDGDEIYPEDTAKEIVQVTKEPSHKLVVVRRYDLLGDVYHRQKENIGAYVQFGETGHLLTRLLNKNSIKGLNVNGDYPLEGYFDQNGRSIRELDRSEVYVTNNYLYHAMYLKRSSLGNNLKSMFNRSKYKVEKGILIDHKAPEILLKSHPSFVRGHLESRSLGYELMASFVTPIKTLKRRLLPNT